MGRLKSLILRLSLYLLALGALLYATHGILLAALGNYLVRADSPEHADIAVVLAGDSYGHRILKAAELVKQEYVPKVLVSGPSGDYGLHESDLAIAFAVQHGYPKDWFVPCPNDSRSTEEEAKVILPVLRRMKIRSFLLVTSNYHTRRAGSIYRSLAPDLKIRVIAAPDEYFRPGKWWHSRQASKIFFFEWSKTVATWIGL